MTKSEPDSGIIKVPQIYSPFPSAIHSRHAVIEQQAAEWTGRYITGDLRNKLVRQNIGTFAARILPGGQEEVVSLLAKCIIWLFGIDDGHCEEGELGRQPGELVAALSRLLRIAQNPDAPMLQNDPLANGLRDLRRAMSLHATTGQVARWVDALREYFFSVAWEAHHRSHGTIPTLNDYTLMRIYDGATSVILPLLEMGYGYELHPSERDRPEVRAAAEMASFIITWDNDLFSYHKESRRGGFYLNALLVLQHDHHNVQEALKKAIAQRDRVTIRFLSVTSHLSKNASPQLRRYLTSLQHFIRGSQDWGITSRRYITPEDPADLPSAFTSAPTDTSTAPLDIPAISGWWEQPEHKPAGRIRRMLTATPNTGER